MLHAVLLACLHKRDTSNALHQYEWKCEICAEIEARRLFETELVKFGAATCYFPRGCDDVIQHVYHIHYGTGFILVHRSLLACFRHWAS